ncbi:MAG: hypothetical protein HQL32_07835 [Planctomycetes bacterium]|nr:hypothetical protein [Planctomycetota bacterium]
MKKLFLAALLCFGFLGCQYQFGTGSSNLRGKYYIDDLGNKSAYRLFGSELQNSLVTVLRRNRDAKITGVSEATHKISGFIKSVRILEKERDRITGRVVEAQMIITFSAKVDGPNGVKDLTVTNKSLKNSSGTFRMSSESEEEIKEREASIEAIDDLAEAFFAKLSGSW